MRDFSDDLSIDAEKMPHGFVTNEKSASPKGYKIQYTEK